MSDVYRPPKALQDVAHCSSMEDYTKKYKESIEDPYAFWNPIVEVGLDLDLDIWHFYERTVNWKVVV